MKILDFFENFWFFNEFSKIKKNIKKTQKNSIFFNIFSFFSRKISIFSSGGDLAGNYAFQPENNVILTRLWRGYPSEPVCSGRGFGHGFSRNQQAIRFELVPFWVTIMTWKSWFRFLIRIWRIASWFLQKLFILWSRIRKNEISRFGTKKS
jgi:hypothetical protein